MQVSVASCLRVAIRLQLTLAVWEEDSRQITMAAMEPKDDMKPPVGWAQAAKCHRAGKTPITVPVTVLAAAAPLVPGIHSPVKQGDPVK